MSENKENLESSNDEDNSIDQSTEYEISDASNKGWVPKDKYDGDPSKWVDAKTFVERGKKFNVNLQREVDFLKNKVSQFEGTAKQAQKFYTEAMNRKDEEYSSAINELRKQKVEAMREGEDEQVIAIEDKIEILRDDRKKFKDDAVLNEAPAQPPKELIDWVEDGNQWFKDDVKLQAYAVEMAKELQRKDGTLVGRKLLDRISEEIRSDFPNKFGNQRRNSPSITESSTVARSKNGKTEKDLPDEDRKIMKELVRSGHLTADQFLKEYRWN